MSLQRLDSRLYWSVTYHRYRERDLLLKFGILSMAVIAATVIANWPLSGEPRINRLVLTNIDSTKGSKPLNIALLSDLDV